ncbi:hypothetical protein [Halomarina rubra]|uniref:DUF7993 domain-containing protein n=1 Tax=Halomarina rubra TaxID=2071873 RepID=A0ABD6AYW1_9EURY|nr:hypothetical protein [Halomarina rubra]
MSDDAPPFGVRLAQLLASELVARTDGPLARLELVDVADSDALDPDELGELAYGVVLHESVAADEETESKGDGTGERTRLADVYAHDDRARVEFRAGVDAVAAAAQDADLRVRPKAVDPPRTLVFVEDGGEVKRVLAAVHAAVEASDDAAHD